MIDNDTLPSMDDGQDQGPSEQELLDAVMANSPIMDEVAPPLPEEEEMVQDPEESDVEDPEDESEEAVSEEEEEVEEDEEEVEDEDADDESATQEADVFTSDDLDLDAKVLVKVDGEEQEVSFGDLMKGYQTDAHLSKKGRELGEAQKAWEEEKAQQIEQVNHVAEASAAILMQGEKLFADQYNDLEKQIEKARADGDTYEMNELKDKREQAQKNYWASRKRRESVMEQVKEQKEALEVENWNKQLEHFHEEIPNLIPDFDEKVATDIRNFAVEDAGLDPNVLDSITDPKIVYAIYDYMNLKKGIAKGTAKRKAVPSKKAVPTKKAKPAQKKAQDKAKVVRAKGLSEDASKEDQDAFLRQYAAKSLNL